jgi:drug/metabolite transporter (DMT)-like permease
MNHSRFSNHHVGLALVAMAALSWSSAGLFTRAISADLMTMLFWRGLFSGTAVFLFHCIQERRIAVSDFGRMGWPGLGVAGLSALSMITGIGALRYGKVADALVIYATVPFMTAGLAYLVFGERTRRGTIIASMVALAGVGIMMSGAEWGGALFGRLLAVFMALGMAGFSVIMRHHRSLPMLPAMAASAWLVSLICFSFATPMGITTHDLVLTAMFGILQNAAGLVFYTLGTRRIPAAEATLLAALEVPLTPFWVWLIMNETPGFYTLIGGAIVLAALFGHILSEVWRKPNGSSSAAELPPI